jgi:hypothetical protein
MRTVKGMAYVSGAVSRIPFFNGFSVYAFTR